MANAKIPPVTRSSMQRPDPGKLYKPLSEILKQGFTWAVVGQSQPDGSSAPTKWKLVENAYVFLEVMDSNPGPSPGCSDAGWYQGHIKLIACSDLRSTELYKEAISRIGEVWKGARLVPTRFLTVSDPKREFRLGPRTRNHPQDPQNQQ